MGLVKQFAMPRLGAMVKQFEKPWKICGMGYACGEFYTCVCHNKDRTKSQVLRGYDVIHDDMKPENASSNETIGNPIEFGGYVGFVGENGYVWVWDGKRMSRGFETEYASAAAIWRGEPVVLDTRDGRISIRNAWGAKVGRMPGDGIALAACEHNGLLWAAVADGSPAGSGLACSDGSLIRGEACQCVAEFAGQLVYSTGNCVCMLDGLVRALDCEKVMDMKVVGNHIYIAGANPDSLWIGNARGEIALVGRVEHGNKEVGGSCFRVRVMVDPYDREGYFGRTADGDQGEVYRILW